MSLDLVVSFTLTRNLLCLNIGGFYKEEHYDPLTKAPEVRCMNIVFLC